MKLHASPAADHPSRWAWWEQTGQDAGYALRQWVKAPGFAATVIITMALAIGACTIVFTAINSTLLHPVAGKAMNGEVLIHETLLPRQPQMQLSPGMFVDVQNQAKSFTAVTAWAGSSLTLQTDAEPLQLRGAVITKELVAEWSPVPALGRNFTAEEFAKGEHVMMLTYALWQRAFRGAPDVINRTFNTDNGPCTVVGIIPKEFGRYGSDMEFWIPLGLFEPRRGNHFLQVGARLKPGVTLAQAQAELDVIAANTARQYPDTNKGVGLLVRDFGAYLNRSLAPMLHILLGAVACVLLIACANVANLLLARATVRAREVSIRAALGASRGRLMRQLLVESLLLAGAGGGLGILLAQWGLRFIRVYGPSAGTDMARLAYIELDWPVLVFTVGFSLLTGVIFGLAPAWLGSHVDLNEALKQGSRGSSEGGMRGGLRRGLVVLEVALAMVLLAAAGLLLRSFDRLARVDPGFSPEHAATMQILLKGRKYTNPALCAQFGDQLLERLGALPGIEAAGISNLTPFNAAGPFPFEIVGHPPAGNQRGAVPFMVSPGYFQTLGIRLVRGRTINPRDGVSGPMVVVINEALVRQYFPNENPLGQSLKITFGPNAVAAEIVGIVGDVMQGTPGEPPPPQFYVPRGPLLGNGFYVSVRTTGDPAAALAMVKSQVYAVDRDQPVGPAQTMQAMMDDKLARSHVMLLLLGAYGLIALVIAAVGIYAVMAYSVSQRTVEFGIRMALGAGRADVLKQVLRQGMVMVAAGLVLGLAAALALGRVVQSLLYDLSPRDPVTLAAIALLLVVVAFFACLLPARRATKVDPVIALRAE